MMSKRKSRGIDEKIRTQVPFSFSASSESGEAGIKWIALGVAFALHVIVLMT